MSEVSSGEMKRSLTLTGITVNAMALIAPGAFLWTTFQIQASQKGGTTATDMWTGLLFSLVLALLTAYSYSELARIYPDAGAGSSYYFAEAALLDRDGPKMRAFARTAKLTVGWISHLYYWLYPAIMVGFMGILFGYLYQAIFHHTLTYIPQAIGCVALALVCGYIAFRGISGSTMTAILINVIQITCLVAVSFLFIAYRLGHAHTGIYAFANAGKVVVPHSFIHVIYQSTIAILLLVGFESVTALGAEALRPEKDIKKGVLLSLIIQGGICYLFEYFSANFAVSTVTTANPAIKLPPGTDPLGGFASAGSDPAPIGTMVKNVATTTLHAGTTVSLIVAATVLIALVGTTLACLNTGVRVTYAMAKDKEMPGLLGLLHGRFATPHGGILVLTLISAAIGVYCATPYNVDNITQVTLASNTGTFLVYGMTCLIAVVAFAQRHDKHLVKHTLVPVLGSLMNLAELFGVVYLAITAGGTSSKDAYKALGIVGVWIVIGIIWVAVNPNKHHAKKVHQERMPTTVAASETPVAV